jgi:deoxyribodipyrimidine photo-lyase
MSKKSLFIFRRDLRITDNRGLLPLAGSKVIPVFIFNPEQVSNKNALRSQNAVQFMFESLASLEKDIAQQGGKLHFLVGHPKNVVRDLAVELEVDTVALNSDITPYSKEIVKQIYDSISTISNAPRVILSNDHYLANPQQIKTQAGEPYKKFTPYYEEALKYPIAKPTDAAVEFIAADLKNTKLPVISLSEAAKKFGITANKQIAVRGGRERAIAILKNPQNLAEYRDTRNILSMPTSMLSAYIKFGCVSIREVYWAFKKNADFIRQLYWRDFYAQLLDSHPQLLYKSLKPRYDRIKWDKNDKYLKAWQAGMTGFPIVDACMRQLNTIGWMHNRGRLIVASFLVKVLCLNWREGEHYFAQTLVDYDVASNSGNWAWVSGSGADSQPYFRIFNPSLQGATYDPDCKYIKNWIPELSNVPAKDIHKWEVKHRMYLDQGVKYYAPIVDYKTQKERALKLYEDALR